MQDGCRPVFGQHSRGILRQRSLGTTNELSLHFQSQQIQNRARVNALALARKRSPEFNSRPDFEVSATATPGGPLHHEEITLWCGVRPDSSFIQVLVRAEMKMIIVACRDRYSCRSWPPTPGTWGRLRNVIGGQLPVAFRVISCSAVLPSQDNVYLAD
jgi:hypothetical protein